MTREKMVKKLIEIARSQIGKPYKFGSDISWESKTKPCSFDCSSFVQWCFNGIGINIFKKRRSTILQAAATGKKVIRRLSGLQPGDLIFFDGERGYYRCDSFNGQKIDVGHVAIYIGNGKIIHATGGTGMVTEEELIKVLKQPYRKITYMKRYF